MKKLALFLAVISAHALTLQAQVATDPTQNGYVTFQQSSTGADVLPSPIGGTDTLVYAAGALNLVHNTGVPAPVATTASTVANALSLASTPTACPAGQALNAIDAKGNAVTCVPVASTSTGTTTGVSASSAALYSYAQPAIQSGDTLTGTANVYASEATIPTSVLTVGRTIDVEASGTYDINSAQESGAGALWIRIGGVRVASGNFRTSIGVGKNYLWIAHFRAIVRSVGNSGTIDPLLQVVSSTNPYGGTVELASFNATATVNTSLTNSVQVEFDAASTNDSATLRQLNVTVH